MKHRFTITKRVAKTIALGIAIAGLLKVLLADWRGRDIGEAVGSTAVSLILVGSLYIVFRRPEE